MNPTPELPYETDITRANEKIFELWTALEGLIPAFKMDSDPDKTYLIEVFAAMEALSNVQKIEVEPQPSCGYFAGSKSDPRD